MSAEETPSEVFKHDYKMLELHEFDTWKTARANYRRLVHKWHPDKYTHRPREQAHAQQQFIELTKSYNSLRSFYRANQRLPFESANQPAKAGNQSEQKPKRNSPHVEDSILGRERSVRSPAHEGAKSHGKIFWFIGIFAMMIGTAALSLMLDLNANKANMEIGKETLRQTPQSEFMPSAAEIRKNQARGAFVQPTK
ncbi:MAG: J domain-containing protein [Granulosicoccus sp.]